MVVAFSFQKFLVVLRDQFGFLQIQFNHYLSRIFIYLLLNIFWYFSEHFINKIQLNLNLLLTVYYFSDQWKIGFPAFLDNTYRHEVFESLMFVSISTE